MASDARQWVTALHQSHDRLVEIVGSLDTGAIEGPSYCDDWIVAQVLSHLGSGAEIGLANLEAMVAEEPAPARELYQSIWDTWNAKSPEAMAADALVSDERHVSRLVGLSDEQLDGLSTQFMGRTLDASGIVGMRLAEHAVHVWDIEVTTDPVAVLQLGATALVLSLLPSRVARLARGDKPAATPVDLAVETVVPATGYTLNIGEEVALADGTAAASEGQLSLPAESLIRLVYGRLDPDHTPAAVKIEGPVTLADLRVLFPGF